MASEKNIKRVLDILTTKPTAELESLHDSAKEHRNSIRAVMREKNVIGIGISEKISKKKPTGNLSLTFYVEKKIPLNKLKAHLAIPPTVPESLSGREAVPTDVVVVGKIKPELKPNITRKKIQPGFSIGHINSTAGTLGALVTDGKAHYILSNSHVLALSGTAKKGNLIVYPGPMDGGKNPADLVAKLHDFKKFIAGGDFVNKVDCALAKPMSNKLGALTAEIIGIGLPKGVIEPKRGMKVVKVGRTSGKTVGEILDVNFRFSLPYDDDGIGEVGFIDQVLCTRYTKPGDSGSLVIDQKSGKAVGLHFAGAHGGSVFNPITEVLSALKVKIVTTQDVKTKKDNKK